MLALIVSDGRRIGVNILDSDAKGLTGGVLALFCGIIGTAMLMRYFRKQLRCNTPVEAEIMRNDVSKGGKSGKLYAPEYSYHYEDKHYTFQSTAYTEQHYEVGQKVTVYIDPANPEQCRDKQKRSRFLLWTGLFFELLAAAGVYLVLSLLF